MSYNQVTQPIVSGNFGHQGYTERWKRDFIPIKVTKHASVSERLKKFKKPIPDQSYNENLNHRLQLHKKSNNSVYTKDFRHNPVKVIHKTKEMVEQSREKVHVDGSETFKSTYNEHFVPKDHSSVKGKNLAQRSKDCSVNRVKPRKDNFGIKSGYGRDYQQNRFNTLCDTDNIKTTQELNKGSIKRVMGYMGHIPENLTIDKKLNMERNHRATYYTKANPNIPGYSGFVPKEIVNHRDKPFVIDSRTTKETDYCLKKLDPNITKKNGLKHYTLKEFFNMPDTGSQDGLSAAHKYFKHYRPFEGMPKI